MIRLIQRRLIIPRGDTGAFTIPVLAKNTGGVAVFSIIDTLTQKKIFEKTVEVSGEVMNIEFSHADTVNLPVGKYVWDIKFYINPQFVDGVLVDGTEVDSYYAAFTLPVCEIRQTGDLLLTADDAPTSTVAPDSLNIIAAAMSEANSAKRESAANAANAANSVAEIAALVQAIPTKVSEFENDAGYLIQHQDISGKANSADLATVATSGSYNDLLNKPFIPSAVSDLTDDSGHYTKPVGGIPAADLAETYLTSFTETDPTVPSWAKAANKPTYTAAEVGAASKADPSFTGSISLGRQSGTTVGSGSVAVGNRVTASGKQSHAEGYLSSAIGGYAHAEGYSTTASGQASHVEGYGTTASGDMSHAEGYYTTASGYISHAEGYSATASGYTSHAEGYSTTASNQNSHAEGYDTTASGYASHAEGYVTTASGIASHAEGYGTIATGNSQHVVGTFNKADGTIAIVVNKENAETFDSTKEMYPAGSIILDNGTYWIAHNNANVKRSHPRYDSYSWHKYTGTVTGDEPEWNDQTLYAYNDVIKDGSDYYQMHQSSGYTLPYVKPGVAPDGDINWHSQSAGSVYNYYTYKEIVGNGAQYTEGYNIRTLDIAGNERLTGDLYVRCNGDNTGGTKVATMTDIPTVLVTDVQVNGTSILNNGVANVPFASQAVAGVVQFATATDIKAGNGTGKSINPARQEASTFYGLAKAAGADMASITDATVGVYPGAQKSAIQAMLGILDMIAPTEGAQASKAYSIGKAFCHAGALYKATAEIASGDAIIPGTNCEQTTIIDLIGI